MDGDVWVRGAISNNWWGLRWSSHWGPPRLRLCRLLVDENEDARHDAAVSWWTAS